MRELTGGIYFGKPAGTEVRDGKRTGWNTMIYNEDESPDRACSLSGSTEATQQVCSVDKANVLDVSRVWREVSLK